MKLNREMIDLRAYTAIKQYAEHRLETHRKQNDGDKNLEDTFKLRGRIAELRALLNELDPAETPDLGAPREY